MDEMHEKNEEVEKANEMIREQIKELIDKYPD